ncbi:MAG: NADH-quinone oxidoreductase subunit C [Candidatus Omnitrophica bacterium]|nr:NADH-quinone oxidoreductase subunit C [Candidatus Omnitrophota bacterium]
MNREQIVKELKDLFKEDIVDFFDKSEKRIYIEVKPESMLKVATHIFKTLKARFNIASGIDTRLDIEILYHFTVEDINLLISLRVKLPKKKSIEIDSLTPIMKGADWVEREIHELLGVKFTGHPNLKRLLLPDEWPKDSYPLRRDYKEWDKGAIRDRGV